MIDMTIETVVLTGGKGNETLMTINNNPTITFSMDDTKINKDAFSALCDSMAQVGVSAKEAGETLRRLSIRLYDPISEEFRSTYDILNDVADRWNAIGNVNPFTPEEIAQGLLRAETLGTTENPNQKEPFDFLEQNAYEEADSGWLTPLDSV